MTATDKQFATALARVLAKLQLDSSAIATNTAAGTRPPRPAASTAGGSSHQPPTGRTAR